MEVSTLGGRRQPRTLCCISPPRPSPIRPLHIMRPCFCTLVLRITAERCLCLSSVVGERSLAGVDTNTCFTPQIWPSSRLRPRRPTQHMGAWTSLAGATTSCLHVRVQFPWVERASGITLSRGVGKKTDVRRQCLFGEQRGV